MSTGIIRSFRWRVAKDKIEAISPEKQVKQLAGKALDAIVAIATVKNPKEGITRALLLSNIFVWLFVGCFWYYYREEFRELLFAKLKEPPGVQAGSDQDLLLRSLLNEEVSRVKIVIYNYEIGAEEVKYSVPPLPNGYVTFRSFDRNDKQFKTHENYQCFAYSRISPAGQSQAIVTYPFYGSRNFALPAGFIRVELAKDNPDSERYCRRLAGIVPAIANLY